MAGYGAAAVAPSGKARDLPFLGVCALLFLAAAWGTAAWSDSMSGGMPMPGGWTMSMAWMRMPEQTWAGAAVTFLGMWVLMMVAMMLPSLVAMLSSYRHSIRLEGEPRRGALSAVVGAGYFTVWTIVGIIAYALGAGVAAAEMRWQALAQSVPVATGIILAMAGGIQLSAWKARQLACCRSRCAAPSFPPDVPSAWRHGLRLGTHCASCCAGFMLVLLAAGVMDLGVMIAVACGITAERLAPGPKRAARAIGAFLIAAGVVVIGRALDLV